MSFVSTACSVPNIAPGGLDSAIDLPPRETANDIGLVTVDALVVTAVGDLVHQCTGTPLRGTGLVVTAGHCVLVVEGSNQVVTPRHITVSTSGHSRTVTAQVHEIVVPADLVTERLGEHRPEHDVALLVTDIDWPDVGADTTGSWAPDVDYEGFGFQTVGPDGARLLPGQTPRRPCATIDCTDEPELRRLTNRSALTRTRVMTKCRGSTEPIGDEALDIVCGLGAGASGGPVIQRIDGDIVLVGIVSTVLADGRRNRVARAHTVEDLMDGTIDTLRIPLGAP